MKNTPKNFKTAFTLMSAAFVVAVIALVSVTSDYAAANSNNNLAAVVGAASSPLVQKHVIFTSSVSQIKSGDSVTLSYSATDPSVTSCKFRYGTTIQDVAVPGATTVTPRMPFFRFGTYNQIYYLQCYSSQAKDTIIARLDVGVTR